MTNKLSNIKERILFVLDYKGVTKSSFFEKIGMTYGNFTGKNKETPINSNAIANILSEFPDLLPEWLLTGKGDIFKDDSNSIQLMSKNRKTKDSIIESQEIPLYSLEATAGLKELFASDIPSQILDTIKIPNLPKCDGAITVTGDSMYPLLKSGDIVLYKETQVKNIFFGEMYLLSVQLDEWDEFITVKYIQKSEKGEEFVKLVSQNTHHQSRDVHVSTITALAMVKASIRINSMI